MKRETLDKNLTQLDETETIESTTVKDLVFGLRDKDTKVLIPSPFVNKNNSFFIHINNYALTAVNFILKAGNAYPNSMLGDFEFEVSPFNISVIYIKDQSRFITNTDDIILVVPKDFVGCIYTVAREV